MLDFAALQPGHAASETLRRIAATIPPQYQATVRLTGPVAMADEEFGTIKENATSNGVITFAIVAPHPLACATLGEIDRGRIHQSLRRPAADCRAGPVHGRLVQSHFGLFRGAVRRHRRRFRHPVQRSLSLRTA